MKTSPAQQLAAKLKRTSPEPKSSGNALRATRVVLGIPLVKAARAMGLAQSTLHGIEMGASPSVAHIQVIERFYGLKFSELWPDCSPRTTK